MSSLPAGSAQYTDDIAKCILKSHAEFVGGPLMCQISSFEEFMDYLLPLLVHEHSIIEVDAGGEKHTIRLHTMTVGIPTHKDPDGSVYDMTPALARHTSQTYESLVSVNMEHIIIKNGEERKCDYVNVPLTYMPIMVKSKYCTARHTSPDGGYFIVRGHEKVVQPQVRLRNNTVLVFPGKTASRHACNGEARCVHWLKLRSTSTLKFVVPKGSFNVFFELPFLKMDVPVVAIFRLLGINDTATMIHLVYPPGAPPPPTGALRLLHSALNHDAGLMTLAQLHEWLESNGARTGTAEKPLGWHVDRLFSNELLPHLGCDDSEAVRFKKATFIGMIVRRVTAVYLKTEPMDDRDDEANKRVSMVGALLGLLFRQLLRRFVKTLHTVIYKTLVAGNKTLNIKALMTSKSMSADLRYAFGTGNWSAQRSTGTQVGVTQILNHMSIMSLQSALERVNTPMCREGKYTQMRQLHPTQWGIYCPDETPEGQACGLQKNLTRTAYVRGGRIAEDVFFQSILTVLEGKVKPWAFRDVPPYVIINGDIMGSFIRKDAESVESTIDYLRELRRDGIMYRYCSVSKVYDGVCISCDSGCVMRPLVVVSRLHLIPDILATSKHAATPLFTRLFHAGVIEYLDKQEESFMRVAERQADAVDDGAGKFTHYEIHPIAILGRCASVIPNSDRNQAPRNMYQAAMVKQAVGIPCEDWSTRIETMHVPWYPQTPFAKTLYEQESGASGCNAVVAILTYTGKNQEDSLIANKYAIDRGLFRSSYFSVYKDVCSSSGGANEEIIENPARVDGCVNLQHGNFSHLGDDGLPDVGAAIEVDDVVIGKTLTKVDISDAGKRKPGGGVKTDHSTRSKSSGIVDRVAMMQRDGMTMAKVVVREMRVPEVGDKVSSRHGQKGILGLLMPQEDMPFVASGPMAGMTPDLIVNPHAITSRMTLGHLAESLQSVLGCITGKPQDATPFQADASGAVERVADQLHNAGFQRHGHVRMMNGMTGEMMEASIFFGVVYYQRLKHMVRDKIHARTRGPINFLTRQPLEGRSRDGGQRFGEMERDAGVAHGASEFVADRLIHSTDPFEVPVCKLCGCMAEAAHDAAFGVTVVGTSAYCRACDTHDVVIVNLPYASKLVLQELYAVGIAIRLDTTKK